VGERQSVGDDLGSRWRRVAEVGVDPAALGALGQCGAAYGVDGYRAGARRAAALGIEGKWAIHPSQVALANEVFSPPAAEVDRARRIVEELRKAEADGRGAAAVDGKMIDAASERMARTVLEMADAIAASGGR